MGKFVEHMPSTSAEAEQHMEVNIAAERRMRYGIQDQRNETDNVDYAIFAPSHDAEPASWYSHCGPT